MIRIDKKKILSLLLTGTLALTNLPYAMAEMQVEGDKVKATKKVNVRTNNGFDGDIIGSIPKGDMVHRILSCDNGWSLIRHNHRIGFVKDEFITDITDENIYCDLDFYEIRCTLRTIDNVNLRLDPFVEADAISTVPRNTRVEVLAFTSNNWYLVNYRDKLGFVYGGLLQEDKKEEKYVVRANHEVNIRSKASTSSTRIDILYPGDELPLLSDYNNEWYEVDYYGDVAYVMKKFVTAVNYTPISFIKVVKIKNNSCLYSMADVNSPIIDYFDDVQTGEVITEEGDFYLIHNLDFDGYVLKSDTINLKGVSVIVDRSSQKLIVYEDNDIALVANTVTGKDTTPTPTGEYRVISKYETAVLYGNDYPEGIEVENYIKITPDGIGIHVTPEKRKEYIGRLGGDYYHKNGSHACIRLSKQAGHKVYQLTRVNTRVIVEK